MFLLMMWQINIM